MIESTTVCKPQDEKLLSYLLDEINCLEEVLETMQQESVSVDEAVGMISGIQRDIVQIYRAAA